MSFPCYTTMPLPWQPSLGDSYKPEALHHMVTRFKSFLACYKISSHSIIAFVATLVVAYNTNTQFHQQVSTAYSHFPAWAKIAAELVIACYGWYKNNQA